MSHKTLTVAAVKKYFTNAHVIDTTCFDECHFFHVVTGRHNVLFKLIVTQFFCATAMLLRSLKRIF